MRTCGEKRLHIVLNTTLAVVQKTGGKDHYLKLQPKSNSPESGKKRDRMRKNKTHPFTVLQMLRSCEEVEG